MPTRAPDDRPLRPSTQTLVKSGADSRKIDEAQKRIIDGLRASLKNLVDRLFDDAGEAVRSALLHFGLDLYHEGLMRGRVQAVRVYQGYLTCLDRGYAEMPRDSRLEVERPGVTLRQLHTELIIRGHDLTPAELVEACRELEVSLAKDKDPE